MASSATVTLDTTPPAGVTANIAAGASQTGVQAVNVDVGCSDASTVGYQMKVWGDVDPAADPDVQTTEAASNWITYVASKTVTLSAGDALKTINVRVRDDVWNQSAAAADTITLNTTAPVVTISSGPTPAKISKVAGKRSSSITWQTDLTFDQYEVEVVAGAGSARGSGTVIGSTNGSTNVAGSAGGYPAATSITTAIDGADLEAASVGDGAKICKIFVKNAAGVWSA